MWNRMIFKLSEARQTPTSNLDLTKLRYFRHVYLFGDGSKSFTEDSIYFTGIRMIESPANSYIVSNAKVLQHIDMSGIATSQSNGATFALNANVNTYLRNTPGLNIEYTSSDPSVIRINEDGTATVLAGGSATITASVPGDDRYVAASEEITVACKDSQSALTISSAATHTYGIDYALAVSGGSGTGAVTYKLIAEGTTGSGTVTGSTLKITKVGTFKLKAAKAGDDGYVAAESAEFTLTVAKKAITVNIADAQIELGAAVPTTFMVTLASGSTIMEGDTLSGVAQFTFECDADNNEAGTYAITATVTSDNYAITVNAGELTVAKAEGGGCKNAVVSFGVLLSLVAAALVFKKKTY
jgi:hypothetical protein